MNLVTLFGNLTADVEVKTTKAGKNYAQFTVAVDDGADKDGKRKVQFIRCVAWEKTADNMAAYCRKGNPILLTGRIVNGSYQDPKLENVTRYTTDVVVNYVQFIGTKEKADENIPE